MDPAVASVAVSFIASAGAIGVAIIAGRNSADRLAREDLIRRQARKIVDLGGDPDDI